MNIAVIGGGVGGLAVSCRLAKEGHQVDLYDKNDFLGGKMGVWEKGGYRFDKGPSLFTMPQLIEELFLFCGKTPDNYFSYQALDITCNYFDQGVKLIAYTDPKKFAIEAENVLGISQTEVLEYLDKAKKIYQTSEPIFVTDNKSLMSWTGINLAFQLVLSGGFSSLNRLNQHSFSHPILVKIFNRFATYNGSNPYKAPSVLSCIAALEHTYGAFYPKGGMSSIPVALSELAKDLGVNLKLNQEVQHLGKSENKFVVNEKKYEAVFYNGDVYQLPKICDLNLNIQLPELQNLSTSGLVFYWGIKRTFSELDVHNIFFAKDYQEEFKAFDEGKLYLEDPTVYIHVSSKIEDSAAPEGKENWFVMVNVPAKEISPENQSAMRASIINKLSSALKTDIEALIEVESYFNPQIMQSNTSAYHGALYGLNSNSVSNIMKRPKNKSAFKGLYFVGGTVFPGGGIPLCLSSAKIASKEFKKDFIS